jgi:hypothetical protein
MGAAEDSAEVRGTGITDAATRWDVDQVNHVGVVSRKDTQQSMRAPGEFGTDRAERLERIRGEEHSAAARLDEPFGVADDVDNSVRADEVDVTGVYQSLAAAEG